MPAIAVAAVAAAMSGAMAAASGAVILGLTGTMLGVAVGALSFAMSVVMQVLAPTPGKGPQGTAAPPLAAQDRQANIRQPIMHWQQIYGQARVGGAITFQHTTNNNKTLHYLLTIAGHSVDEIGALYLNEHIVNLDSNGNAISPTDPDPSIPNWSGKLTVWRGLGTDDGDANLWDAMRSNCSDKWTDEHKQRGRAKVYLKFEYDSNLFAGGFPKITVVVRGKKVYDPRGTSISITSSSVGSPGLFSTSSPHNLSVGDEVYIANHSDAIGGRDIGPIDGAYIVDTAPTASTFTLRDSSYAVNITVAGTGGIVSKMAWSANPVLCTRDYMADKYVGPSILSTEIDDSGSGIAGSNICEQYVQLASNSETFTANSTTNIITLSSDVSWPTGTQVYISSTGSLPSGLPNSGPYYVVNTNPGGSGSTSEYKLSNTSRNALSFDVISLGSSGSGTLTIFRGVSFTASVSPYKSWDDRAYLSLYPDVAGEILGGTGGGWWGNGSVGNFIPVTSGAQRGEDHYINVGQAEGRQSFYTDGNGYLLTSAYTSISSTISGISSTTYTTSSIPYRTGDKVKVFSTGSLPSGLSSSETYYWISNDTQNGHIASSLINAISGIPVEFSDSGTGTHIVYSTHEQRYTCNGVLDTTKVPSSIIQDLMSSMSGKVAWTGGQFVMLPGYYRAPSVTIDENDVIGPIQVQSRISRRDLYNRVKGTFIDPTSSWQPNDFPAVISSSYTQEDQGVPLWANFDLGFTDSPSTAQRLAAIAMESVRRQMTVTMSCKLTLLETRVGDVVMVNNTRFGWSNKTFEIVDWTFASIMVDGGGDTQVPYLGINLMLRETDADVYAWSSSQQVVTLPAPRTNLPTPWLVSPPSNIVTSESVYTTDGGSALLSSLSVSWDISLDESVQYYYVSYKPSGQTIWSPAIPTTPDSTNTKILGLSPGQYDIRVQAINSLGASSEYSTVDNVNILGISLLPSLNAPQITSISESLVEVNGGQGVNSQATVSFSSPPNTEWDSSGVSIIYYQVEYRRVGDAFWVILGTPDSSPQVALGAVGSFEWRVKATMSIGVDTPYSDIFSYELRGLTDPPSDITGFSVQSVNGLAYVQWDASQDLDVKIGGFIRVKYTPLTSGAVWNDGTDIGPQFPGTSTHGVLPLLTGTYMIKAVDSSENYSANESSMSVTAPVIQRFSGIIDIDEHPSFSGPKTNMVVSGSDLQLGTGALFDDLGLIDSLGLIDYAGGIVSAGSYEFANIADLGGVYTVRVTSNVNSVAFNTGDLIDSRTSYIDAWGSFDGTVINSISLQLHISTTNDNPSGVPTWSPWKPFYIGDYSARAMRFRVIVTNSDSTSNISISELAVNIAIPHVTLDICTSTSISASGQSFTYSSISGGHSFYSPPTINITPSNMATGDYYLISSATRSGFTIQFFNSSGVGISRTVDISVSGFGQQTA